MIPMNKLRDTVLELVNPLFNETKELVMRATSQANTVSEFKHLVDNLKADMNRNMESFKQFNEFRRDIYRIENELERTNDTNLAIQEKMQSHERMFN